MYKLVRLIIFAKGISPSIYVQIRPKLEIYLMFSLNHNHLFNLYKLKLTH
ncbi:MAG: hypothetical protein K0R94_542 [Burkholderiales bacterium]|jgi:hypothetical protein|nr:hypothetical protein [Burkholderiales bacterium]